MFQLALLCIVICLVCWFGQGSIYGLTAVARWVLGHDLRASALDLVGDLLPVIFLVTVLDPGVGTVCSVNTRYFHICRHSKAPFTPSLTVRAEEVSGADSDIAFDPG